MKVIVKMFSFSLFVFSLSSLSAEVSLWGTQALDVNKIKSGTHKASNGVTYESDKSSSGIIRVVPAGAIFAFEGNCPKGTKKLTGMAGRTIVGSGLLSDGTLSHRYLLGQRGGKQRHKLSIGEMPKHQHITSWGEAFPRMARWGVVAGRSRGGSASSDWDNYNFKTSPQGGSGYHENRMPYKVFSWCKLL